MTFLQFVESLEEKLTSTDKDIRLNGIKSFVTIVKKLPLDFFSSEELDYINQFLCDRFIDHHSFIPSVLSGIEYTVSYGVSINININIIQMKLYVHFYHNKFRCK